MGPLRKFKLLRIVKNIMYYENHYDSKFLYESLSKDEIEFISKEINKKKNIKKIEDLDKKIKKTIIMFLHKKAQKNYKGDRWNIHNFITWSSLISDGELISNLKEEKETQRIFEEKILIPLTKRKIFFNSIGIFLYEDQQYIKEESNNKYHDKILSFYFPEDFV